MIGIQSGQFTHDFGDSVAKQADRKEMDSFSFPVIKNASFYVELIQKFFLRAVISIDILLRQNLIVQFSTQRIPLQSKERAIHRVNQHFVLHNTAHLLLKSSLIDIRGKVFKKRKSDPQILPYGLERIRVICLTYFLCGLMDVTCGVVRGMGAAVTPTIVSLTGACVLRVIWIYTVFVAFHSLFVLYLSYPVTWVVTCAVHLICFSIFYRRLRQSSAVSVRD